MKLNISPAITEDKNAIWLLFKSYMKDYVDTIWQWDEQWQQQHFCKEFQQKTYLKLHSDNNIFGYLQFQKNKDDTYLYMIIVANDLQNKGLGKELLDLVQQTQPTKPLRLRCFKINQGAQRFYQNNGFRVVRSEEHYLLYERGPLR